MAVINSWNYKAYAAAEGAFGQGPGTGSTQGVFAATDGIEFISIDVPPAQKARTRHRKDKTATRSMSTEFVHGHYEPVEVTITRSIALSGSAGTASDTTALMTNAYADEAISGGTSVTYDPSQTENPSDSVALLLTDDGNELTMGFYGGVVTNHTMEVGDEEPTETFTIRFAQFWTVAKSTLTASDGSTTTVTVGAADRFVNPYGVVIECESEDILTSTDPDDWAPSTGTFTNVTRAHNSTSGAAHSAAASNALIPSSQTVAGSPVGEHQTTATIHGTTVQIMRASYSFDTGRDLRPISRGEDFASGLVNRRMEASGSMGGLMDTGTDTELLGESVHNDSGTAVLVIGDTAGSIRTVTLTATEIQNVVTGPQDEEEVEFDLDFLCRGSSGNDDVTIVDT